MSHLEAEDRVTSFVPHAFPEHIIDLGEVRLNYSVLGNPDLPALLVVPAQSESWWGYERAMPLLAEHFQVYAVDLRGQGRSTWTPGRYTVDNMGNDLVRFIDVVIGRPTIVSGLSSGGLIAAWLAAYAKPGQILAAVLEDPPLFASEVRTTCGQPINQGMGPSFELWNKWLGNQWERGDWAGMRAAAPHELPKSLLRALSVMIPGLGGGAPVDGPPQNLKEYDPEWARSFLSGVATAACDHGTMLAHVKVPILLTHHWHDFDEDEGVYLGAISDVQVKRARQLITEAGQTFAYLSFPDMPHSMHAHQPELYAETVRDWVGSLTDSSPTAL